jgi:glutamate---cysteine ligase / carboxylate-amine ligase
LTVPPTTGLPTLGVEEELHLVDIGTGELAARAPEVLATLPTDGYGHELQQSTVETNTRIWRTLDDLDRDIRQLRRELVTVARPLRLGLAAVGTVPLDNSPELDVTPTRRFARMHEDYQLLVEEQLICGTQVHVGVEDRDVAVAVSQRVLAWLPVFLALSASSPYWHGLDTGYASIRTMIWQRWPTAGATGPIGSAAEYDALIADLIATGVIADAKMAYFDVRPSAHAPTVELRVCDACPLVEDAILLAGLFRALVAQEVAAVGAGEPPRHAVAAPVHRAAMWRAARSGLGGELVVPGQRVPLPAADAVHALLADLRPQLEDFGDWDVVRGLASDALARGTSAERQRAALRRRGRLTDIVDQVVAETEQLTVLDSLAPVIDDYALHRQVVARIEGAPPALLRSRLAQRDRAVEAAGMLFIVDGHRRPFEIDLLPRIVPAGEWEALSAGLAQRARALEAFLQDVYGPANVVSDGVLPEELVTSAPGWRAAGRRIPPGVAHAPVMGFDLLAGEDGIWRVLEDNVRVPSGAGYALAARELLDRVMPDLPRPGLLRDPSTAMTLLQDTLRAVAPAGVAEPIAALISDGADNSAWFEHRLLAERADLILAGLADVEVTGENVVVHRGSEQLPVDVLYLRLASEVDELVTAEGRPIGAELVDAAAAGWVTLVNAPGCGVADDKATYPYVPALIEYYLGEKALLADVRTLWCRSDADRAYVLDRLAELVTKPVDGYGGDGVLIGPDASADELRRRAAEIRADPERWVGQDLVTMSAQPAVVDGGLEDRRVDLRAFVYLSGPGAEQARVADLALTRVAPVGSMVVNSSRGGGAKDTWLLSG